MADHRLHAPAATRNRAPILEVLRRILPAQGTVLEIASGSGEHVVFFAEHLPALKFQPTDPDPDALLSIEAWTHTSGATNVAAPLKLDAAADEWPIDRADAIICINMIHIAPWEATQGLLRHAATILPAGAPLYLYGPFRRHGETWAESNEAFDRSLRAQNPEWGVRQLETVAHLAGTNGFGPPDITPMPANNLSIVFRRQ